VRILQIWDVKMKRKKGLDETFKSFLSGFADRTYFRWSLPAAKVAADQTPPNGHGEFQRS
jgi:hypothetical protein